MQLPLPDIQRAADFFHVGFEFIHMVHAVVADAKRANLTSFLRFDQSFPCAFPGFSAAIGRVDQVEIDVGEFGLRKGGFDGFLDTERQEEERKKEGPHWNLWAGL